MAAKNRRARMSAVMDRHSSEISLTVMTSGTFNYTILDVKVLGIKDTSLTGNVLCFINSIYNKDSRKVCMVHFRNYYISVDLYVYKREDNLSMFARKTKVTRI